MVKRMLVDATHPEETRVVILNGTRLEEFDFETSTKKQLKGNIYLAKVTRVEPSLQAAFVEFGGNRHGFLAFSEIHPDYYQIPVEDRMALLAEQERDLKQTADVEEPPHSPADHPDEHAWQAEHAAGEPVVDEGSAPPSTAPDDRLVTDPGYVADERLHGEQVPETHAAESGESDEAPRQASGESLSEVETPTEIETIGGAATEPEPQPDISHTTEPPEFAHTEPAGPAARPRYEDVGGEDDDHEAMAARRKARTYRHRYKIQEVIKRRQILLVQVVKEERGTKGAALTTYLSLAGRYCVLMPNTVRGGGVSRRIASAADRKRLKECIDELGIPEGMAIILRTAAVERSKAEIKRDFEYLLRQWDQVRELTLKSVAPALVYEEASLIKRAIRDLYLKDIDEVLVEGEEGYRMAKEFMRLLMPSHAKRVQLYNDPEIPLYHRYQVETQLDAMHTPTVNLKSGGYIVINPTEALVAIDVNSGRATRERNIEETAYKTNIEAADEIARQLRLRDLGGLIVIDFIDMEDHRNVHNVERRVKEAMKSDRARIQIGRISPFGLLELSRQRLRPSLLEASTERCPHCAGSGMIRSTESTALHVLRAVEEEGIRHRTAEIALTLPTSVAMYVLNQKRARLNEIEARYSFTVRVTIDEALIPPAFKLERVRTREAPPPSERPVPVMAGSVEALPDNAIDEAVEEVTEPQDEVEETAPERSETAHEEVDTDRDFRRGRGRRRRGRRGDMREDRGEAHREQQPRPPREPAHPHGESFALTPAAVGAMLDGRPVSSADEENGEDEVQAESGQPFGQDNGQEETLGPDGQPRRRRRRGRRGGRRRRRPHWEGQPDDGQPGDNQTGEAPSTGDLSQPGFTQSYESGDERQEHAPEPKQRRERPQPAPEHGVSSRDKERRTSSSEQRREAAEPARPPEPSPEPSSSPSEANQPRRKGWWQRFTS